MSVLFSTGAAYGVEIFTSLYFDSFSIFFKRLKNIKLINTIIKINKTAILIPSTLIVAVVAGPLGCLGISV